MNGKRSETKIGWTHGRNIIHNDARNSSSSTSSRRTGLSFVRSFSSPGRWKTERVLERGLLLERTAWYFEQDVHNLECHVGTGGSIRHTNKRTWYTKSLRSISSSRLKHRWRGDDNRIGVRLGGHASCCLPMTLRHHTLTLICGNMD